MRAGKAVDLHMKLSPLAVRTTLYSNRGFRPKALASAMDSLVQSASTHPVDAYPVTQIWMAQKTWLMSLKSLAAPTTSPTTESFPSGSRVSASSTGRAVLMAAEVPETMMVRVPDAARVDPPDTGESTI